MNYLITGGAGFIGSNYLNMVVPTHGKDTFIVIDNLNYAANLNYLAKLSQLPNFCFIKCDILDYRLLEEIFKSKQIDTVINFAAETSVDRSFLYPILFEKVNVEGTLNLLTLSVKYNVKRFHQISTDEVYGDSSLNNNILPFVEDSQLFPTNPYSKSKALADIICQIYSKQFPMKITISRSTNNYGANQDDSKLIPVIIKKALKNEKIPIYDNGENIRNWIFAKDHCKAIEKIVEDNNANGIYNISGNTELSNIDLAKLILKKLGKNETLIYFIKRRKINDKKYTLNTDKYISKYGIISTENFETGLNKTIEYYKEER